MAFRRYAGPRRSGGYFRYTSRFTAVERQVTDLTASAMEQLRRDILNWLLSNLHRWTGQMADEAFAEVYVERGEIVVRFGSTAPHTFWHEVRYHPQMRQCADLFGPQIARRLASALAGVR